MNKEYNSCPDSSSNSDRNDRVVLENEQFEVEENFLGVFMTDFEEWI